MAREETFEAPTAMAPARRASSFTDQLIEPLTRLRGEVDRLFDDFPFRFPSMPAARPGAALPALDMSETDKLYKITAELPGMDADDIEVTFDEGMILIAGEKKVEREENEKGYRLSERSYGRFERAVELPGAIDPASFEASFRNGLLTVTVDKDGKKAAPVRKIAIAKG